VSRKRSSAPPWVLTSRAVLHATGVKLAEQRNQIAALEAVVAKLQERIEQLEQRSASRLRAVGGE